MQKGRSSPVKSPKVLPVVQVLQELLLINRKLVRIERQLTRIEKRLEHDPEQVRRIEEGLEAQRAALAAAVDANTPKQ